MNFQFIFNFKANRLISLVLNVLKLAFINVKGKSFRATNLLNAYNKLSDNSVTNSRWVLPVAAQVKIRIWDLYVSLFEE